MYDTNTQLMYLAVFMAQPELYTKMKRVHKPSHYSATVQKAVEYIDEYYDEYSSLPDIVMIKAKTGIDVPVIDHVDHGIESWFMKEYPQFSLHKSLERALYVADEEVQKGNYDAMESIINQAHEVRLAFDYGLVYNEDPEARLKNILERSGNISSGFKGIDGTVGKLNAGDLVIYAGPSGCVTYDTPVRVIRLPKISTCTTNNSRLPRNVKHWVEYLSNFYHVSSIRDHVNGDRKALKSLYDDAQPITVPIGELMDNHTTDTYSYVVDSPDGWVPVVDCFEKTKDEMYEVSMSNGTIIRASHDHLFQKPDLSWHFARDLSVGNELLGDNGIETIVSLKSYNEETKVYDLSVGHKNHRYYTDGICSHNSGKSLFLQNHAINHWKDGLNVLQITLELHPELVSRRMDCMLLNKSVAELYSDLRATALEIAMFSKKHSVGDLRVKYMPSGSTTAEIKNLVKMYMNDTRKKVDILIIDYLDLVNPVQKFSMGDTFGKDKLVSEELRNIGQELGPVVLTASQLNRCLTLDTKVIIKGKGSIDIKDVNVGDEIKTDKGYNTIKGVSDITKKKVYKITTKSGKVIRCSENHVFPTGGGEMSINTGLRVGSTLYSISNDVLSGDEIVSIEFDGYEDTIDIETDGNHLFIANGILTHNSAVGLEELDHSNIAGGLSKINTADLVFGILTSNAMRERGEYALQVLKSRNSAGTGRKIPMLINAQSMRIYDDPDYVAKIAAYMNMSTDEANKNHHANEVSQTYNELQDAINQSNKTKNTPPDKSPTGTVGSVYGAIPDTSTPEVGDDGQMNDPLGVHVESSDDFDDDRFASVKNLFNRP